MTNVDALKSIETRRKIALVIINTGTCLTRTSIFLASTILGASSKLVGHFIPTPTLGIGQALENGVIKLVSGGAKLATKMINNWAEHSKQRLIP